MGSYDTYVVQRQRASSQAGCGESGFGNNCKSHMCRVYACAPEEIIGDTDMDEIVSRFAPNEELV